MQLNSNVGLHEEYQEQHVDSVIVIVIVIMRVSLSIRGALEGLEKEKDRAWIGRVVSHKWEN